jgi:hypothetical protein
LSDTVALRELFGQGATFTQNDRVAIARAIEATMAQLDTLSPGMQALREKMESDWQQRWKRLIEYLADK